MVSVFVYSLPRLVFFLYCGSSDSLVTLCTVTSWSWQRVVHYCYPNISIFDANWTATFCTRRYMLSSMMKYGPSLVTNIRSGSLWFCISIPTLARCMISPDSIVLPSITSTCLRTPRTCSGIISWQAYSWLINATSAKNISVRAESLRQSGRALSEPSETPRLWITPRPASMPRAALHIALWTPFRRFLSLCRSPNLNKHSGVVGNCDHTSECVHSVQACIRIAMWRCENLSSRSFYFKLEERRKKVRRYDTTPAGRIRAIAWIHEISERASETKS